MPLNNTVLGQFIFSLQIYTQFYKFFGIDENNQEEKFIVNK